MRRRQSIDSGHYRLKKESSVDTSNTKVKAKRSENKSRSTLCNGPSNPLMKLKREGAYSSLRAYQGLGAERWQMKRVRRWHWRSLTHSSPDKKEKWKELSGWLNDSSLFLFFIHLSHDWERLARGNSRAARRRRMTDNSSCCFIRAREIVAKRRASWKIRTSCKIERKGLSRSRSQEHDRHDIVRPLRASHANIDDSYTMKIEWIIKVVADLPDVKLRRSRLNQLFSLVRAVDEWWCSFFFPIFIDSKKKIKCQTCTEGSADHSADLCNKVRDKRTIFFWPIAAVGFSWSGWNHITKENIDLQIDCWKAADSYNQKEIRLFFCFIPFFPIDFFLFVFPLKMYTLCPIYRWILNGAL